ncbi:hypothetical protein GCM10007852_25370 [Agaribacter marinus]|uniref:Uncharacterized protein n=1 Tax=Agaribacter marinus TaxID=1431249 RepID=A0AA37WKI4_9ALTE|nr:hypothetical protein GCM10007852_25370 [Agaribacter marinus]
MSRIEYIHTVRFDGFIQKVGWYIGPKWIGKWDLHSTRLREMTRCLESDYNV